MTKDILSTHDVESTHSPFFQTLRKISDHPFVTQESRDKRSELSLMEEELGKELGPSALVAIVPIGSVGAGMAHTESDKDAFVYVLGNGEKADEYCLNHGLRDITVVNLMERLQRGISESEMMFLLDSKREKSLFGTNLGNISFLFAPSLSEDGNMNSPINKMRRVFLEILVQKYPEQAEIIWRNITENIKHFLVNYGDLEWGRSEKEKTKRYYRTGSVISQTIVGRLKLDASQANSQEKFAKAERFIDTVRKKFSYPTLQEMCSEFNIAHSSEKI